MRSVLLMVLVLAVSAGLADAQVNPAAGRIGIFNDAGASNCVFTQPGAGNLFQVYIVHVENTLGITGVTFQAVKPACLNALWLNDTNVFSVVIGNTQTGYNVGYGACRTGNVHICTMNFLSQGASPTCCVYYVLDEPNIPGPYYEFSDCDFNLVYGGAKAGMTNPGTCTCESIPTQDSSWGQIKALYYE